MATYPAAIKTFREVEDVAGVSYDAENTTTIYAKDTGDLFDEVHAIETTLGVNPQASSGTVAARLTAIEDDLGTATGGENATIVSRVTTIEDTLGDNVEGTEATVAARLAAMQLAIEASGGSAIEDLQTQIDDLRDIIYGDIQAQIDDVYDVLTDHEDRLVWIESNI